MGITSRARLAGVLLVIAGVLFLGVRCGSSTGDSAQDPWRVQDEFVRAVNQGIYLMERYEYASAAEAFGRALELSPDSIEARLRLAFAESNNPPADGDAGRAERLLDEVLERDPSNVQALYLRGILYVNAGESLAALPLLEQVVELEPHDAFAWYVLARAKRLGGADGEVELRRAIEECPTLAGAWYDLFRVVSGRGEEEQALQLLEHFQELQESRFKVEVSLPKYRRMGPLGVVHPLPVAQRAALAPASLSFGAPRTILEGLAQREQQGRAGLVLAAGDLDGDGDLDLATLGTRPEGGTGLLVARNEGASGFVAQPVEGVENARAVALGDVDNDGDLDLFVACEGPNHLYLGAGDGSFTDVSATAGVAGPSEAVSSSAVFLDADHDSDLDLYVCNRADAEGSPIANQLLRNNSDGTFVDVAAEVGAECASVASLSLAPIDLDDDRDTDLVVFNEGAAVTFLENALHDGYREWEVAAAPLAGAGGGVAQDFDGDGLPDLALFAHGDEPGRLHLSQGRGRLSSGSALEGAPRGAARVGDFDLDGDLDLATLGDGLRLWRNDGSGGFAPLGTVGPAGDELVDLTGDGVVDLLALEAAGAGPAALVLRPGELTPPAHWLALEVTGKLHTPQSMRSPKSGFGTKVRVQCGVHGQVLTHTGLAGGLGQSCRALRFGLDGADRSDYVMLRWPDGITQSETDLACDQRHVLPEVQRKPDSCPMLFAWNGERFAFVGDFAGIGGMGYYAGPGAPPPPVAKELVRIDGAALVARDGRFELRVGEPMQEVAYVDRLVLLAGDHPEGIAGQPDERMGGGGAPPSQELLALGEPLFPARATGIDGPIPIANLRHADRRYAYEPLRDRRFVGYCEPHQLVLDFGAELAQLDPERPTYLLIDGSLEFPYSQTNFAALQAGVTWDPPRVELCPQGGEWRTVVADAGAPGGLHRTIAIDLGDELPAGPCALRLTTNLEVYYDRAFIAQDRGRSQLEVRTVPLVSAELRRLGFPKEYSPDGGHPILYDYDSVQPTCDLQRLPGRYTRYGPVEELLVEFDDLYAVMATGDEIAVEYDAEVLPELVEGFARTYVLVSHAYCKDLDLHSVGPRAVAPLPFRGMSNYPYPAGECYPTDELHRRFLEEYNTRTVR